MPSSNALMIWSTLKTDDAAAKIALVLLFARSAVKFGILEIIASSIFPKLSSKIVFRYFLVFAIHCPSCLPLLSSRNNPFIKQTDIRRSGYCLYQAFSGRFAIKLIKRLPCSGRTFDISFVERDLLSRTLSTVGFLFPSGDVSVFIFSQFSRLNFLKWYKTQSPSFANLIDCVFSPVVVFPFNSSSLINSFGFFPSISSYSFFINCATSFDGDNRSLFGWSNCDLNLHSGIFPFGCAFL